jgi:ATPase subunit of ABC transporter with duplicated ATPase domains
MIQISNLTKFYGDTCVLDSVSFILNKGERAGLIGPNGCGKTTLLRIIVDQEKPDAGSVHFTIPGVSVGYLSQGAEYPPDASVAQVMEGAIPGLSEARMKVESLAQRMGTLESQELERAVADYGRALEHFERLGGYGIERRMQLLLAGLGLGQVGGQPGRNVPVGILSGGQKTRLGLARCLLAQPDLLLLDEPTNHLDIEALEWLEDFLRAYEGAVLVVSHDRAFLDQVAGKILELDELTHRLTVYDGNYSAYIEAKERELVQQWATYKDQQETIARMRAVIRAHKGYASEIERGSIDFAIRARAKDIARRGVVLGHRLERFLESDDIVEKPAPTWKMKLEFEATPRSGEDVLALEDVSMAFEGHELFSRASLTLQRGERVALVGPNGSGKTTLLRIIAGGLAPTTGRLRLGAGVRVGYYAQEQETLSPESTPYAEIRGLAPLDETETRSFLHYFLFAGDEVFTPIGQLSYGERARLALARLVAQGCNLLLLDEPINHLDIPSRASFEQAMGVFEGTVLAVVHDRYFIRRFATRLWAIRASTVRAYLDLDDLRRAQEGS